MSGLWRRGVEVKRLDKNGRKTRYLGYPWTLLLSAGWAGLVVTVFLQHYLAKLETSYGVLTKLKTEGLLGVLARWIGM